MQYAIRLITSLMLLAKVLAYSESDVNRCAGKPFKLSKIAVAVYDEITKLQYAALGGVVLPGVVELSDMIISFSPTSATQWLPNVIDPDPSILYKPEGDELVIDGGCRINGTYRILPPVNDSVEADQMPLGLARPSPIAQARAEFLHVFAGRPTTGSFQAHVSGAISFGYLNSRHGTPTLTTLPTYMFNGIILETAFPVRLALLLNNPISVRIMRLTNDAIARAELSVAAEEESQMPQQPASRQSSSQQLIGPEATDANDVARRQTQQSDNGKAAEPQVVQQQSDGPSIPKESSIHKRVEKRSLRAEMQSAKARTGNRKSPAAKGSQKLATGQQSQVSPASFGAGPTVAEAQKENKEPARIVKAPPFLCAIPDAIDGTKNLPIRNIRMVGSQENTIRRRFASAVLSLNAVETLLHFGGTVDILFGASVKTTQNAADAFAMNGTFRASIFCQAGERPQGNYYMTANLVSEQRAEGIEMLSAPVVRGSNPAAPNTKAEDNIKVVIRRQLESVLRKVSKG